MDDYFEDEISESKLKRAVIAGASEALKKRKYDWKLGDEEIIQDITDRINEIIENID